MTKTNPYQEELHKLLEPIKDIEISGYASYGHGHLKDTNGKEYLPWYYLEYRFRDAGQVDIYNSFFKEFEKTNQNNLAWEYDYNYYSIDLYENILAPKLKDAISKNTDSLRERLKIAIEKYGEDNCHFDEIDKNYYRYGYGNIMGLGSLSEDLVSEFEEHIEKTV